MPQGVSASIARACVVSVGIIGFIGCTNGPEGVPSQGGEVRHALMQMDDCSELESYAKQAALQRVVAHLEAQKALAEQCWKQDEVETDQEWPTEPEWDTEGEPQPTEQEWPTGEEPQPTEPEWQTDWDTDTAGVPPGIPDGEEDTDTDTEWETDNAWDTSWSQDTATESGPTWGTGGDSDPGNDDGSGGDGVGEWTGEGHSETNVQEHGVDEADIVKTDGEYLYVVASDDFVLVDAQDNGKLQELGRLSIGGVPEELVFFKDLVVVFSRLNQDEVPESIRTAKPSWIGETDWQYDRGRYQSYSQVSVIDIEAPSSPKLIRTMLHAGSYVSSRRVGSALRVVVASEIPALDVLADSLSWQTFCHLPEETGRPAMNGAYDAIFEHLRDTIESADIDQILPRKLELTEGNLDQAQAEPMVACEDVYGPITPAGTGLLSVISVDLEQPLEQKRDIGVFGQKGLVYASDTSLYLTTSSDYVQMAWDSGLWDAQSTGIYRFDLGVDADQAVYRSFGEVDGRMLDQFCLGEHDGYLRVATTSGHENDFTTWNNHVFVLEENIDKKQLQVVGQIDDIARQEQEKLYAARFQGDRGFLVTFRETDPLFTVDLSDPFRPELVGAWYGPGFSTYLHPFGDDRLISVGLENWRIAVSLYDLSDFAHPRLLSRYFPGMGYNSFDSIAVQDHRALTFHNTEDLIMMPYRAQSWNGYPERGLFLMNIGEETIEEYGKLDVLDSTKMQSLMESGVERAAFIDSHLYAVSRCRVSSAHFSNPAEMLDTLPLYNGDHCEVADLNDGDEFETDPDPGWEPDTDTVWNSEPDTDPHWDSEIDTDDSSWETGSGG